MKKEIPTIITTPRTTAHDQSKLTGYRLKIGQMKRRHDNTDLYMKKEEEEEKSIAVKKSAQR